MADRNPQYARNSRLEALLDRLGDILEGPEQKAVNEFRCPQLPPVFVHGCARSGTTLMMQTLADLDLFAYPTNLLSRFYRSPYIGALIQLMLTDRRYNYRDEFAELRDVGISYESELGKTRGILSPNEFNYFWRRFFPTKDAMSPPHDTPGNRERGLLLSEMAAMEAAFGRPLLMKAMILNWHISFLAELFTNAIFIHVNRDVLFNAQSLLEARIDFFGDVNEWYSFKPPEYALLASKDPIEQVLGQVISTNRAVRDELRSVPDARKLTVGYERLCDAPDEVAGEIVSLLNENGYEHRHGTAASVRGPQRDRNMRRIDETTWRRMEQVLLDIESTLT